MHTPDIHTLKKSFESRVRLGIMSVLMVNEQMDFNSMKDLLQVTDGNLASHAGALEKEGFLRIQKEFAGKKTLTTYSATESGTKAFEEHLSALEKLIRRGEKPVSKGGEAPTSPPTGRA